MANTAPFLDAGSITEFTDVYAVSASDADGISSVKLVFIIGESVQSLDMALVDGEYKTSVPKANVGEVVKYYVVATDNTGLKSYYPSNGTNEPAEFSVVGGISELEFTGEMDGNRGNVTFTATPLYPEQVDELRLYYFLPEENKVMVFPVGIGREGLETPRTTSYIGQKRENPVWRPTKETRARYLAEHGEELAREVPAGPDNPFGKYALRLGFSEYLIHGSNQRFGIGMRASSGCIRMYDNDIKWLFDHVPEKTPVHIIEQTVKMSYEKDNLRLIEIHQPLTKEGVAPKEVTVPESVKSFIGGSEHNWPLLLPYFEQPKGVVVAIKKKGKS